jgi:hypothetical protein
MKSVEVAGVKQGIKSDFLKGRCAFGGATRSLTGAA